MEADCNCGKKADAYRLVHVVDGTTPDHIGKVVKDEDMVPRKQDFLGEIISLKRVSLNLNRFLGDLELEVDWSEDQIKHVAGSLTACSAVVFNEWSNQTIKPDALRSKHLPDTGCYRLVFKQNNLFIHLIRSN